MSFLGPPSSHALDGMDEGSETLGDTDSSSDEESSNGSLALPADSEELLYSDSPGTDRRFACPRLLWGTRDNDNLWSPIRGNYDPAGEFGRNLGYERTTENCSCCPGRICAGDLDWGSDRRSESSHCGNSLSSPREQEGPVAVVSPRSHGQVVSRKLFEETPEN